MHIIGDVHGKIDRYLSLLKFLGDESSIQLGDMAVGFRNVNLPPLPAQHRWFDGNHDDALACARHQNYLGRFGSIDPDMFFIAGGLSVDKAYRREYVSWWPTEQLSVAEQNTCFEQYVQAKPRVVLSHECPESILPQVVTNNWKLEQKSHTAGFLQRLYEAHAPEAWYFGHHHNDVTLQDNHTEFHCLNELSHIKVVGVSLKLPWIKERRLKPRS